MLFGVVNREPTERRRPERADHEQADRPRDEQRQEHEHDTDHPVDVRPDAVEAQVSELRQSLYRRDRGAAEALVAAGATVNVFDAAALGDVTACELLLRAGPDPNAAQQGGFVPLDEALITKNEPLAELLRAHRAKVSGNPLPD